MCPFVGHPIRSQGGWCAPLEWCVVAGGRREHALSSFDWVPLVSWTKTSDGGARGGLGVRIYALDASGAPLGRDRAATTMLRGLVIKSRSEVGLRYNGRVDATPPRESGDATPLRSHSKSARCRESVCALKMHCRGAS